jgi:hypothetical protein
MQHRLSVEFDDSPKLSDLTDAVNGMTNAGAPPEAEILLTMGDKGTQRDPWPYLRGLTARWEA